MVRSAKRLRLATGFLPQLLWVTSIETGTRTLQLPIGAQATHRCCLGTAMGHFATEGSMTSAVNLSA